MKLQAKDIRFIIAMIITVAVVWIVAAASNLQIKASTYEKPDELNSQGRIEFGTDVVFDAKDLYYLYEICK